MKPAAALALLALAACGVVKRQVSLADSMQGIAIHHEPVIFVPGALGSILVDGKTGGVEWVRAPHALLPFNGPDLALPVPGAGDSQGKPDRLVAAGVLGAIPIVPGIVSDAIYQPLIDAFVSMGYKAGDCDFPRADEDFFLFAYDFRRDGVEIARRLAEAVERVRDTRSDPEEKVVIVAHSFGGLIVRYYLMYGARDALREPAGLPDGAGARAVSKVVFMGTPHHGAVGLLEFILKGYGYLYPGQLIAPEDIFTFPSTFQVLCDPEEDCFLDGTSWTAGLHPYREPGGLRLNLYDPNSWDRLGWLPAAWRDGPRRRYFETSLQRGLLWWNALHQSWVPPGGLEMLNVSGAAVATPNKGVLVKRTEDRWDLLFTLPWAVPDPAAEVLQRRILSPGDGRVTLESAFDYPHAARVASPAHHDFIHHDQAALANVILFILGDRIVAPDTGHETVRGHGHQP